MAENPFDPDAEADRQADRQRRLDQLARRRHNMPFNKALWRERDKARHGAKPFAPDGSPDSLRAWGAADIGEALDRADRRLVSRILHPASVAEVCAALDSLMDASGFNVPHLRCWSLVQHLHGRGFVRSEDILTASMYRRSANSRERKWLQVMLRCLRRSGAIVMDRNSGYSLSYPVSQGQDVDMALAIGTWLDWASRNRAAWPKTGQDLAGALSVAIERGWYKGTAADVAAIVSKSRRVTL